MSIARSLTRCSAVKLEVTTLLVILMLLTGCASSSKGEREKEAFSSYRLAERSRYQLPTEKKYIETGIASWYGDEFHGRKTSNGEIYNMFALTAAHKTLPMNTQVKVTNLENGKYVILKINDRGPFVKNRIIDLSYAGAERLDMVEPGTAPVRVESIGKVRNLGLERYSVQIGAFQDLSNALALKAEIAQKHDNNVRIKRFLLDNEPIYRVMVGSYKNRKDASCAERKLESKGYEAFIVAE